MHEIGQGQRVSGRYRSGVTPSQHTVWATYYTRYSEFQIFIYMVRTALRDPLIQHICPDRFHLPPPLGLISHGPVTPPPATYPEGLRARCLQ